LIDEFEATVFSYDDRGLEKDMFYTYRITSVDEIGRESDPIEIGNQGDY